jgi:membrane associated rhomboid family serine protease
MNFQNPYGPGKGSFLDEIKAFLRRDDILSRLMMINIVIFVAINMLALLLYVFSIDRDFVQTYGVSRLTYWLSIPSDPGAFLLRPWSIITYMFVQEDVFHLFFNMIVLYVGGRIFTQFVGSQRLLSTYILSGISGALLYIITFNIFPAFQNVVGGSFAIGASASVLGIFIAAAAYVPNLQLNVILIGNVKLKYIAIVFIVLDLINIRTGNAGGHIAHLGGAFYGYLFVSNLRKNKDFSIYFNNFVRKLKNYFTVPQKKKSGFKNVYKKTKRPVRDEDFLKNKNEKQAEIDSILEKIKKSGYDSLTAKEKQMLFDASKD